MLLIYKAKSGHFFFFGCVFLKTDVDADADAGVGNKSAPRGQTRASLVDFVILGQPSFRAVLKGRFQLD